MLGVLVMANHKVLSSDDRRLVAINNMYIYF